MYFVFFNRVFVKNVASAVSVNAYVMPEKLKYSTVDFVFGMDIQTSMPAVQNYVNNVTHEFQTQVRQIFFIKIIIFFSQILSSSLYLTCFIIIFRFNRCFI